MAFPRQLWNAAIVKVLVVLLTIAVLILVDPTYVTAYISINSDIVIIYIVSALTFLYCIVSIVMYFLIVRGDEETPLTNCAMAEAILSALAFVGWIFIIGIGATISQSTSNESGERFGWIGAIAGLITACFLGNLGLFLIPLIKDKILAPRQRRYEKGCNQNDQYV